MRCFSCVIGKRAVETERKEGRQVLVSIIILLGPVLLRLKLVCKCHQGRSKQQLLTVMTNVFLSMFKLLFLKNVYSSFKIKR